MPIGEAGFINPYADEQRKKKRAPAPAPEQQQYEPVSTQTQRLALIEKESARIFPTHVSWALSNLEAERRDAIKTTRLLANKFDVKPSFIFGENDPDKMVDPFTGEVGMSHRTIMRLTDNFAPQAVASILQKVLVPSVTEVATRHGKPGEQTIAAPDVKRVGEFAREIAKSADHTLPLTQGLGISVYLAKMRNENQKGMLDPKQFGSNLRAVMAWADQTHQIISFSQAVSISMNATRMKKNFKSNTDVAMFMLPEDVQARAEEETATREAGFHPVGELDLAKGGTSQAPKLYPYEAAVNKLAYSEQAPDIYKQAEELQNKLYMDETAFQRSWLGRNVIVPLGNAYSTLWRWTEEGLATAATPIAGTLREVTGGDYNTSVAWRNRVFEGLNHGKTLGQIWAEDYHLDPALGNLADFALSWELDPTVLLGKTVKGFRGLRLLGGVEEGESLVNRAGKFVVGQLPGGANYLKGAAVAKGTREFTAWGGMSIKFSRSGTAKGLYKAIYKDTADSGLLMRKIENLRVYHGSSSPLDGQFMRALRENLLAKYPTASDAALKEFQQGVQSHFWGFGPEGSVANDTWKTVLGRRAAAEQALADADLGKGAMYSPQQSGLLYKEASANDMSKKVLQLPDEPLPRVHMPERMEIPRTGLGAKFGLRRAGHSALTSDFMTASKAGRRTERLFSYNPGRVLEFHNAPDAYGLLHARRWAVFTEAETRGYEAAIQKAMDGGAGFEYRIENVMNTIDREGFDRYIAQRYKGEISPEAYSEMWQATYDPIQAANYKLTAFGVVPDIGPEGEAISRIIPSPLVESELRNQRLIADPILVQAQIDRYIGASRRWMGHLRSAVGKESPELQHAINTAISKGAIKSEDILVSVAQGYRRFWKTLTVARPGYIPRVILTDENLRFLVDTGSLSDRLLSQRWSAVDASTSVGKAFGKATGVVQKQLDKRGFFDETIHGLIDPTTGEDLVLPRAGAETYLYEAAASQQLRSSELIDDMLKDARAVQSKTKFSGEYLDVTPAAPGHLKAWAHDLRNVLGNSDPGLVGLRSVKAGDTVAQTEKKILQWAEKDRYSTLKAIGHDPADAKLWASDLADMTHYYTMGDAKIADAAINRVNNLDKLLEKQPRFKTNAKGEILNTEGTVYERTRPGSNPLAGPQKYHVGTPEYVTPTVHGPALEHMLGTKQGMVKAYGDWAYKHFVTMPEDVLNRQPFFRVWKRRAERGYYEALAAAGQPLTAEMRRAVDLASKNFALEQVKATMFEFTKQSRLTELLNVVFPFPQPFFEGFQVWTRLAIAHPEAIGRGKALFNLATDTGFITKNPDGEYIVPMGAFKRLAGLTHALGIGTPRDWDDYSFFSSLNSFNMLAQSTVTIPGGDNVIGRMVGGMPIPVPGFDPVAALLLQNMLKNRPSNDFLASLVFQFGPQNASNLLPGVVRAGLKAFYPQSLGDEHVTAVQESILRSYQVNGLDKDENGDPIPVAELVKMAHEDALDVMHMAGVFSLFSPAALRIKDPGTDTSNELTNLINDKGVTEGFKEFTHLHPDLTLFAVSKTFFSGYDEANYGEDRPAPKVPASQFAWDLLHSEQVTPFLHEHPEWAALLLVGMNPDVTDKFDFGIFSRMAKSHFLSYKDPTRFWTEGENSAAWTEVSKWYKTTWPGMLRYAESHGISSGEISYTTKMIQPRQEMLTAIARQYPDWAREHLRETKTGMYDWAGFSGADVPPEIILHDARMIAGMPGYENFPGVQALNQYIDGRDGIEQQMTKLGIVDITSQDAIDAGLTKKYDSLVAGVEKSYPDFAPFVTSFFRGDLQSLDSPQAVFLASVPKEEKERVSKLDVALQTMKEKNKEYDTTAEQYQGYQDIRDFWARKTEADPQAVDAWIKAAYTTPGKLQDERTYLSGLPTVFYSTVDWKLMGVKLSPKASKWMAEIGQARVDIEKLYAERLTTKDPYSKGDGYDAIDAFVKQHINDDKTFSEAVKATNTWGWGVVAAGLVDKPGRAGEFWKKMVNNAHYLQQQADKQELNGKNYDSDDNQAAYASAQTQFLNLAKKYMKHSGEFEAQWYDLQDQLDPDGGLITVFMPDDYFPLGGYGHYLDLTKGKL